MVIVCLGILFWVAQLGEQIFYINKTNAESLAAINAAKHIVLKINGKFGCGISWTNHGGVIAAWALAKSVAKVSLNAD
jgi:hypothetical protein